jgi:predicted MFS family arabinose efflux permease
VKDRLFSRIAQLTSAGYMASAMIGAYVANVDIAWPWLLGAAGYLTSAFLGGALMRGERARERRLEIAALPRRLAGRVVQGLGAGFSSRPVLMLSAAGALQFAAWAPYWMEWPIMFDRGYGVGVWIIGWIYCLLTIARIAGAEGASRLRGARSARAARMAALVGAASLLLAAAGTFQRRPTLALALLFAMNLAAGALAPLAQSWFNEQIESSQRATLLSFSSTFNTIGGSVGLLAGGVVADRAGLAAAWQVAGLVLLAAAPCYLAMRPGRGSTTPAAAIGAVR